MAPQACAFASPVAFLRPRSAAATSTRSAPAIRMAAASNGEKKKQSLLEWLDSKIMPHQADYDETMSETYMREIMDAREAKMEEMYKEQK